jgi:TatD DNase family protein
MIHDREAHDDVLRVLDQQGAPEVVIFHCFSGDVEFARRCAERAYFMSFAGNVTFKNAASLREAAASAPAETLLVETDGPFLTPMPHRGAPNGPYLMPHTVRLLAELRGERLETLCELLWSNAQRALRLAPELP